MSEEAVDNAVDAAPAEPAETSWQEQAGVSGNPAFEKFESVGDLAKSYGELEAYRGNSIRIPSGEAGEEDWAEFDSKIVGKVPNMIRLDESNMDNVYSQLGVPKEVTGYEFSEVEGFEDDAESLSAFTSMAHENRLTKAQADGIHNWLASNIQAENQASQEAYEQSMNELQKEWGSAFEHNVQSARAAVDMIEQHVPGFKDYLDETGNGNDPMFMRMASALANQFGEKADIPARPSGVMTPDEAKMMINEIRANPEHPYNDEMNPAHEAASNKMRELYKLANP